MANGEHFIKNIEIKNFKCFKGFETSGFSRVNLIGGKNNVGKTVLMEAIYLYTSSSIVMVYQRLLILKTYRDMQEMLLSNDKDEDILKSLIFENQDIDIGTEKKEDVSEQEQCEYNGNSVGIYDSSNIFKIEKDKNTGSFYCRVKNDTVTIEQGLYIPEENIYHDKIHYKDEHSLSELINVLHSSMPKVRYSTSKVFIGTNLNDNNLLEEIIGDLKINNKYDSFNKYLNKLFNIDNLDFINKKPMVKINNEYQNLTTLGEGIKSIIFYIGSMLTLTENYIFIDEIENGIHYSKLDDVWELILTISKEQNIQVFATTHSKECIESYARVSKKVSKDDTTFTVLNRLKDESIRAIVRDYDRFMNSIEDERELR